MNRSFLLAGLCAALIGSAYAQEKPTSSLQLAARLP